jgi:6-phosphogluconolactonase (cycloisomerase 2 family)
VSPISGSPFPTPIYTQALAAGANLLFALNQGVLTYRVDAASGALSQLSTTLLAPINDAGCCDSIVTDPGGAFVYAFARLDHEILGFQVNGSTGTLSAISASPWISSSFVGAGAAHVPPNGKFLCMVDRGTTTNLRCFTRDTTTGQLLDFPTGVTAPSSANRISDFAFTPDSASMLVLTAAQLCVFAAPGQPQTSHCVANGGTDGASLAVHPTGRFVAVTLFSASKVAIFSLDATGNLTPSSTATTPLNPEALAFSKSGDFLFVGAAPGLASYAFHSADGSLTELQGSPDTTSGSTQGFVVAF